jgi:tight adherence protein B
VSPILIIALAALVALGVFIALAASLAGSGTDRLPVRSARRARDQQFDGERLAGAASIASNNARTKPGALRRSQAQHLSDRLIAAGIKLRPSEFRGIQLALALTLGGIGALRFGQVIPAAIMAVAGWFAPSLYLRQRQGHMRSVINAQLTETLTTLANSLKAGLNLPQALDAVARSGFHPLSDEFARVVREMSMGATIEQALTNLIRRTQNEDLELAVTAILIHNTIGGNLASVLDSIEKTIRTRVAIASELTTLTAQTRASAWVITLLPIGVATLLLFLAPSYFTPMVTSTFGRILLLACGLSILVGNLLIRRLTRAEV